MTLFDSLERKVVSNVQFFSIDVDSVISMLQELCKR